MFSFGHNTVRPQKDLGPFPGNQVLGLLGFFGEENMGDPVRNPGLPFLAAQAFRATAPISGN